MRVRRASPHPAARLTALSAAGVLMVGALGGGLFWCCTQAALLVEFRAPMRLPLSDAARAGWRLALYGGWRHPQGTFPTRVERALAPGPVQYALVLGLVGVGALAAAVKVRRALALRRWGLRSRGAARSPGGRGSAAG